MGSLGEEELVQMVRDFIESETTPSSATSIKPDDLSPIHKSTCLILQEVVEKHSDEEAEILERISMYLKHIGTSSGPHQTNNLKKLIVMKLRNDGYEASLCKTSWFCPSSNQPKGGYEYIDVMVVENGRPKRVIVDMEFKHQFEVARPTVSYKEMMNSLPLIFVGSEEKLKRIIPLLCSAAKTSMKENGLHVPPWRKPAYMHSKWLSKNCNKVSQLSPQDLAIENHHKDKADDDQDSTSASCFPSIFSKGQLQFCLKP